MEHNPKAHLFDIYNACKKIQEFIENKTLQEYAQNEILKAAVERKFLVIGEAMARLRK